MKHGGFNLSLYMVYDIFKLFSREPRKVVMRIEYIKLGLFSKVQALISSWKALK